MMVKIKMMKPQNVRKCASARHRPLQQLALAEYLLSLDLDVASHVRADRLHPFREGSPARPAGPATTGGGPRSRPRPRSTAGQRRFSGPRGPPPAASAASVHRRLPPVLARLTACRPDICRRASCWLVTLADQRGAAPASSLRPTDTLLYTESICQTRPGAGSPAAPGEARRGLHTAGRGLTPVPPEARRDRPGAPSPHRTKGAAGLSGALSKVAAGSIWTPNGPGRGPPRRWLPTGEDAPRAARR